MSHNLILLQIYVTFLVTTFFFV